VVIYYCFSFKLTTESGCNLWVTDVSQSAMKGILFNPWRALENFSYPYIMPRNKE